MELILKEDVENLGFKDDLVIVKNGYGRNFLIPNGLAILATESNKKVLEEKIKQSQKELAENGIEIEKKFIQLGSSIKKTGNYSSNIRLHREVNFELKFEVIKEQK